MTTRCFARASRWSAASGATAASLRTRRCARPAWPISGSNSEEEIAVAALRARSAADLAAARRVVVPSDDVAARLRRHFAGVQPCVEPLRTMRRLADRPSLGAAAAAPRLRDRRHRHRKGLRRSARMRPRCRRARPADANSPSSAIRSDDLRLMATGRVFVTGPYKEAEAVALIRAHRRPPGLAAVGRSGDLVLDPRSCVARRTGRRGVRHRRPGRTDPPHRQGLAAAARNAASGHQQRPACPPRNCRR